jgi:hypothetical protein
MRLRVACLLVALVSGCASFPSGNSPQAVCQRDALNDPAVKQITIEQMNTGAMSGKAKFAYTQAVHEAYNNCLLRRGVTVRGGVEAVRPAY